ncbi:MAG TPA: hypothetical protein VF323_01465 [Candidatus Limnocylindrales bacterium]
MTQRPPRRARSPSPTAIAAIIIVLGISAGGFLALSGAPAATPTASLTSSGAQGSLPPPATGTPEPFESASTSATAAGTSLVAIDRSLLAVLPASVKGIPLVANAEGEAHDLTDPALSGEASALAAALAIDVGTGDFAYASVVRLRPGVFSDAYFKSWRETFDVGACSQAGGVAGSSAEATIAGHQTFIGHCVGGILTYHVHLGDVLLGDLIVSISAQGTQRLGQLVVEGLR